MDASGRYAPGSVPSAILTPAPTFTKFGYRFNYPCLKYRGRDKVRLAFDTGLIKLLLTSARKQCSNEKLVELSQVVSVSHLRLPER